MSVVIVERSFAERITGERLLAQDRSLGWCFDAHRVWPKVHCVATDGRRVCCILQAPDAEAVRRAGRSAGMAPPDRLWAATVHGPAADPEELVRRLVPATRSGALAVVERSFAEPTRFEEVQALEDRGAWCLALHRVGFLASCISLDHRRMICLYEAPDVDAVRRANARLGLPFDRVWCAEPFFHEAPHPGSSARNADDGTPTGNPPAAAGA